MRQLLTLARLDAGAQTDDYGPVSLRALVEDVVRATPRPDAIVVTIDASLSAAVLHSNLECLELAIRNLHENAVQHMRGEGEVRWHLGSSTNSIIVEDTGPGVTEDELPNIGQRFVRGRNKSAIGSGLGLAIARRGASPRRGRPPACQSVQRSRLPRDNSASRQRKVSLKNPNLSCCPFDGHRDCVFHEHGGPPAILTGRRAADANRWAVTRCDRLAGADVLVRMENAQRYAGGADVRIAQEGATVRIVIDDNGPGIPDDQLARVFEPFVRLETSRSRDTGGTGLGLPIARAILEAHGASVALSNRPEGGLRATVAFAIGDDPPMAAAGQPR